MAAHQLFQIRDPALISLAVKYTVSSKLIQRRSDRILIEGIISYNEIESRKVVNLLLAKFSEVNEVLGKSRHSNRSPTY